MPTILSQQLQSFQSHLYEEERSHNTIQKYTRDVKHFIAYLGEQPLCKAQTLAYKQHLAATYAPASVNSMLVALNRFFIWIGQSDCKVKLFKIQKQIFTQPEKELTHREYTRLLETARMQGKQKLSLVIQTICATGIRVSELQFITVASLHTRRTQVSCKGKTRSVFLPKDLCRALKAYCQAQHITKGSVFVSKRGAPLDRSNIWKMMKKLCAAAHVSKDKVFPHNLRHLFACTYYKIEKDISKLADILGHSNINTTRIYTMESGRQHARQLERLNLLHCQI